MNGIFVQTTYKLCLGELYFEYFELCDFSGENNRCIRVYVWFKDDKHVIWMWIWLILKNISLLDRIWSLWLVRFASLTHPQALVSLKKYIPPPLPYFKVNICPLPLPHFASIFFAYLWSFRWPNYIVTLPRYFSFRLPHLNINTGPPSDDLDKNIQRQSHFLFFSQWKRIVTSGPF